MLRTGAGLMVTLAALSLVDCATPQPNLATLRMSVISYNRAMRWKAFGKAAQFIIEEEKSSFLRQHLESKNPPDVQTIEVRGIDWVPKNQVPAAIATIVAEVVVMPSTVVKKIVVQQTWEVRDGRWFIRDWDPGFASKTPSSVDGGQQASKHGRSLVAPAPQGG